MVTILWNLILQQWTYSFSTKIWFKHMDPWSIENYLNLYNSILIFLYLKRRKVQIFIAMPCLFSTNKYSHCNIIWERFWFHTQGYMTNNGLILKQDSFGKSCYNMEWEGKQTLNRNSHLVHSNLSTIFFFYV